VIPLIVVATTLLDASFALYVNVHGLPPSKVAVNIEGTPLHAYAVPVKFTLGLILQ
jgi:hypothetical protein